MIRFVAFLLMLASIARAQLSLEYRVEPLADLYMHVRWLAQQDDANVPARFRAAVEANRAIGEAFGRDFLGWGVLDGHLAHCTTGAELSRAFEDLPEPIRLRGGGEARIRENAAALAAALAELEPWWLEQRWPDRRRTIEHARENLDRTLTPVEGDCLGYMVESLAVEAPDREVPVLLVLDGPWPGAMTFRDTNGHGVCFASISCADDTAFHETILHEATHALDVDNTGRSVFDRLRDGLAEAGIEPASGLLRDVPHGIMFIHAAATIRRHVNPEHVAYGERGGLYERSAYARELIPIWHEYLDGQRSLDATIDRIVEMVVAAERRRAGS